MADGTKIEWTDATANYVSGCSVISPGCTNCYAMRSGGRNLPGHPATGLTKPSKAGHVWTGEVRANDKVLNTVLGWKRPRRIFWNAHGDLFHENVPDEWIDRQFAVMALTPQHQHQVLTKRSARMREYVNEFATGGRYCSDHVCSILAPLPGGGYSTSLAKDPVQLRAAIARCGGSPMNPYQMPNLWLGVSVEDQARADERIPDLLATPSAVRFLSCEPLLGPVDLHGIALADNTTVGCSNVKLDALTGFHRGRPRLDGRVELPSLPLRLPGLDWVIAGGESGPGSRPMHPDWARSLRDQCATAGVPFFFKQMAKKAPIPNDLMVREFPNA